MALRLRPIDREDFEMVEIDKTKKCLIYDCSMNNRDYLGFALSDKWYIFPANVTYVSQTYTPDQTTNLKCLYVIVTKIFVLNKGCTNFPMNDQGIFWFKHDIYPHQYE